MNDLDTLEALARAANDPGYVFATMGSLVVTPQQAAYIAALPPDMTLALIARLRAAERVVEAGQRLLGVLAEDDEPYWWRGEASNLREALAALAETLP